MNHVITIVPEIMLVVFLLATGFIIFACAMRTLGNAAVFGPKTSALIAMSLATILIVGLWQFLGIDLVPEGVAKPMDGDTSLAFKFLLFPCALVAIVTLLLTAVLSSTMSPREALEGAEPVQKAKSVIPTAKKEKQTPPRSRRGRPPKQASSAEAKPADVTKKTETKREANGTTKPPEQG